MTLTELNSRIEGAISSVLGERSYWVVADVSSHSPQPNKGWHFFDLVEKDRDGLAMVARLPAVAWRPGSARIRAFEEETGQRFRSGIQVLVCVTVEYHRVYGLKAVLHDIDPAFTLGQMEQERQRTLKRLVADCSDYIRLEGDRFVTRNNSLAHRSVIQRVAVLSSGASAGYGDFMHTLVHNSFGYQFTVTPFFTSVQGEANAEAVTRRLQDICATVQDFDTVVIIRGGGAETDFLLFDQYMLCKAVAGLHIPVITGIGHQKNETIVDLMAHSPTKTPTKAAEFIIAHNRRFEESVMSLQHAVIIRAQQALAKNNAMLAYASNRTVQGARAGMQQHGEALSESRQSVREISQRRVYREAAALQLLSGNMTRKPATQLARRQLTLEGLQQNIYTRSRNLLARSGSELSLLETAIRLLSPVNILKRGYALVYGDGKIRTSGLGLKGGEQLQVRLQDATLNVTVTNKSETDGDSLKL